MALSQHVREQLKVALTGVHGDELADVIDAGGGTLSILCKRKLEYALGGVAKADAIITVVEAGDPLTGNMARELGVALADMNAGLQIQTEMA